MDQLRFLVDSGTQFEATFVDTAVQPELSMIGSPHRDDPDYIEETGVHFLGDRWIQYSTEYVDTGTQPEVSMFVATAEQVRQVILLTNT